jgi:hypothetical protein
LLFSTPFDLKTAAREDGKEKERREERGAAVRRSIDSGALIPFGLLIRFHTHTKYHQQGLCPWSAP